MKARFAAVGTCLTLLLCLAVCGPSTGAELVASALDLDTSLAEEVVYTDDHDGWLGDGLTHIVLDFPDDGPLEQLEQDRQWIPLPMDATTKALLSFVDAGELASIPQGYYRLIDRHSDIQTPILSRNSYNFTLAVYDAQQRTLHYFEFDT